MSRVPEETREPWEGWCGCSCHCGDDGDIDGPGVCKALPVREVPLVQIVMVPRGAVTSEQGKGNP